MVYVVVCGNLDDTEIVSVHASEATAQAAAQHHRDHYYGGASVESFEVQP